MISERELCRKLLNQLPCSMSICPAFSPFLDPKLFNYDEKIIAAIERGKVPSDMRIRYFCFSFEGVHLRFRVLHLFNAKLQ